MGCRGVGCRGVGRRGMGRCGVGRRGAFLGLPYGHCGFINIKDPALLMSDDGEKLHCRLTQKWKCDAHKFLCVIMTDLSTKSCHNSVVSWPSMTITSDIS